MEFWTLVDGTSAALVVGGTLIATILRAGLRDCFATLRVVLRIWRRRFDAAKVKGELARQAHDIQKDGLLRAAAHHFGDREFDEATGAMLASRSLDALLAHHEAHSARRAAATGTASSVLAQSAELAPVFGLAGTLVSLRRLPDEGLEAAAFAGTISMAVLTTLYGLLLANLILAPLSRAVDRAARHEELQRQELVNWLVEQIKPSLPTPIVRHPQPVKDPVAA